MIYTSVYKHTTMTRSVPIDSVLKHKHKAVVLEKMFVDGVLVQTGPYCPIKYEAPRSYRQYGNTPAKPVGRDEPYRAMYSGRR